MARRKEEITAYNEMRLIASHLGFTPFVDAVEWNFREDNGYTRYEFGFSEEEIGERCIVFNINKTYGDKSISIFIQLPESRKGFIKVTYHAESDFSEIKHFDIDWTTTHDFINAIHETIGKTLLASLM